jgi:hypothetical protein
MKVTKSYIKQLVKEELSRVLNETTNTMVDGVGDIARKTFFGDSANSFMKLVLDKRKEHLITMEGTYNEKDLMIISKEFMPAFREAIAASWDMYPSKRNEAENTLDKSYNDDGSVQMERARSAVSKHFMKELSGRTLAKLSNNSDVIGFMFHMLG